jgi:hypothetical protein
MATAYVVVTEGYAYNSKDSELSFSDETVYLNLLAASEAYHEEINIYSEVYKTKGYAYVSVYRMEYGREQDDEYKDACAHFQSGEWEDYIKLEGVMIEHGIAGWGLLEEYERVARINYAYSLPKAEELTKYQKIEIKNNIKLQEVLVEIGREDLLPE